MKGFIGFVLVVLVVILVLGFFLGWFNVRTGEEPGGDDANVTFSVDKGKIDEDLGEAKEEGQKLIDKAQAAAELEAAEGTITAIDLTARRVTVAVDETTQKSFVVGETADIDAGEKGELLNGLAVGDKVSVVYRAEEGVAKVEKITVLDATAA